MNNQLDEQLEESLLIKVKDTCSGEIIIQKLVAKENIKAQWKNIEDRFEFDYAAGIKWMKKVSEQNTRNRKKLKVIHAGGSKSNARRGREMELQLDRPICRGEVYLSTLRKKSGNYVNDEGKAMADKILQHLPQDQERAATLGVPSKINAYPDDAIGKVHGAEHSGRVRGLGVGVSSTELFSFEVLVLTVKPL
ncbi:hypothetical protein P8452_48361 [Trifolium repens]|nr:hypothetical protein P8452_48361 [Trifolium repens]